MRVLHGGVPQGAGTRISIRRDSDRRLQRARDQPAAFRHDCHLTAVWIDVKVVFSFTPRPLGAAMMATAMPAAMIPYSTAVATVSFFENSRNSGSMATSW